MGLCLIPTDGLARINRQVEIIDGGHGAGAGVIGDRQVLAFEDGGLGHGSIPQ